MKYSGLIFYVLVLAAVYGFVRPGSKAGKAVTAVTDGFKGVLGSKGGDGQ